MNGENTCIYQFLHSLSSRYLCRPDFIVAMNMLVRGKVVVKQVQCEQAQATGDNSQDNYTLLLHLQ